MEVLNDRLDDEYSMDLTSDCESRGVFGALVDGRDADWSLRGGRAEARRVLDSWRPISQPMSVCLWPAIRP